MHVRRGARDVAQRRHLELAEVAVLARDVARAGRGAAGRIVVERAEQVVAACLEPADAFEPAGVHAPRSREERDADVVELAVGEAGADVADVALAPADEEREPALRRERIARCGGVVAAGQRIAELVERRAAGGQRFLEGRERLGDVDRDGLVVGPGRRAERIAIAAERDRRCGAPWPRCARSRCPSRADRRIGRRLCAHRLSPAPSQPNQRCRCASATRGVLRSTRARPCARGSPSASRGRRDGRSRRRWCR